MDHNSLMGIFVNWFPMLLLIAVWLFFLARIRKGGYAPPYVSAQLDEMKRQTALMERIAVALESRRF
jgi:hypothetical protein